MRGFESVSGRDDITLPELDLKDKLLEGSRFLKFYNICLLCVQKKDSEPCGGSKS